jgi:hypothetical protein
VLDLLVGPLHLDLLGLIVDLYGPTTTQPVEVLVTADPNGGLLGSLLCQVASQSRARTRHRLTTTTGPGR